MVPMISSRYYDNKFLRRADVFGAGPTLMRLDDAPLEQALVEGIWKSRGQVASVYELLRARACRQSHTSREAFGRISAPRGDQSGPRVKVVIRRPPHMHTDTQPWS